ncbi:hypothetical protein CgunFtcFv8_025360 [Champsocephalus gunnari]|uniref:Uncharacterized protein n=1 Tax=Champsocephalus gunnari TaxID=52237 RepID=A0AAN8H2X9_CHAGU|nr:hypothetical protein CgunFtcFv8_025360 [Champsocephalus gunnari]
MEDEGSKQQGEKNKIEHGAAGRGASVVIFMKSHVSQRSASASAPDRLQNRCHVRPRGAFGSSPTSQRQIEISCRHVAALRPV